MTCPLKGTSIKGGRFIFLLEKWKNKSIPFKEVLIHSSFPRRRESRYFKNMDSRLRGNDGKEINQSFLKAAPFKRVWLPFVFILFLLASGTVAADWRFDAALRVGEAPRAGLFHQLDGAGRKQVAADAEQVVVVWADNAAGAYQARVAFRALDGNDFGQARQLGSGAEAYQPVVVALGGGRFLFAWEQDERVWLRTGTATALGPPLQLDRRESTQPALAVDAAGRMEVAWARREEGVLRLYSAPLQLSQDGSLTAGKAQPIDAAPARQDQLYPSLGLSATGLVAAWEDRRHGHTRMVTAFRPHEGKFTPPRELNDQPEDPRSVVFGAGYGVTRVALAARDEQVVAVWMDKRDYRSGYDVYAAFSADGGETFGANEAVQDLFGANIPQWRPAVALSPQGTALVVWDDTRDDSPDLWLSWREAGDWSEDLAVGAAYGPEAHTAPAIAFDPRGGLHLVWTSRDAAGISRLWYVQAQETP